LNVTPAQRARQIALTMERLRWTPLLQGRRMIVVNVPEFMLRAYTVEDGRVDVQLEMKIIVGKALDTRTPLFDEDMRYIEFSPYWNVPRSIALQETLPKLREEPGYFAQQGFEFVTPDRRVVEVLSDAAIEAVQQGQWRIRQRPGPHNALGAIKFIFPNNDNIYLHHTPAPRLFARQRRDFSHGCIRVEAPVALARFVLQDDPRWNHERIEEAMNAGVSRTIRLRETLPVLIAYSTVVVKHGQVYFHDDLYGHDRLLDEALRARSAALARTRTPLSGP
ncbi:MAG: L,D-transpeptidase family protein, partial [Rhodoferax sp.]|nr:L,D-transpeptidase family protein [Rhodoferax sp.]